MNAGINAAAMLSKAMFGASRRRDELAVTTLYVNTVIIVERQTHPERNLREDI